MVMRVAILGCGRSLTRFPGPDEYDQILGINRSYCTAPTADACTWACVHDAPWLASHPPLPHQSLYASTAAVQWCAQLGRPRTAQVTDRQLRLYASAYTVQGALALALHLGATSVDLWGCDMRGDYYATGESIGYDIAAHWPRQRTWLAAQILAHRGRVRIRRRGVSG
jgi:hypothetical protein